MTAIHARSFPVVCRGELSFPLRLVVANDVTARLVGQWLSERLGQQFFIENRPDAGTNVGTEAVIRASAGLHSSSPVARPRASSACPSSCR
jgi:tripartite-type tricarboxylate transporter receptor subunit TctC